MADNPLTYSKSLLFCSNVLSRTVTRIADEEFKKYGLVTSNAFLLMTVNSNSGMMPSEIGQVLMLKPSTVTRMLEKLEKQGLVLRQSEGKRTHVMPTHLSLELDPKIHRAWEVIQDRFAEIIGKEDRDRLASMLFDAATRINDE